LVFAIILGICAALAYGRHRAAAEPEALGVGVGAFVLALIVSRGIQVIDKLTVKKGGWF
jgi:hypothetical protein